MGKENLAPPPCLPATWASPRTPGTPVLKALAPSLMPVVKEEAEFGATGDAVCKELSPEGHLSGFQVALGLEKPERAAAQQGGAGESVSYEPAWISSSPVPAPGLETADDAPLPGFGRWRSPKVRNTFLQFESPLRSISVQTPPKSVPSYFAPVGCGHELGPLGRLIDASPAPAAAVDSWSAAAPPEAAEAAEEPGPAARASCQPRDDVLRLRLDDFLAPGPTLQQTLPLQGDFQQATSVPDQMEMMQWICSMAMGPVSVEQHVGAAGFPQQADGHCGMQRQVFSPQDCMAQLGINLSAVPPMADGASAPFAAGGAFDGGAGAFQVPFLPAQAPAHAAPTPALFAQQAQPQAPQLAQQQPQLPMQQMAMQIQQQLLQMQQPLRPAAPAAQPPGPQAVMLAAAFPNPAGGDNSGAIPAAAARATAASTAQGARWSDEPEAIALPPFPMFAPTAEQGGSAQPTSNGRIGISVGHFPEPGHK